MNSLCAHSIVAIALAGLGAAVHEFSSHADDTVAAISSHRAMEDASEGLLTNARMNLKSEDAGADSQDGTDVGDTYEGGYTDYNAKAYSEEYYGHMDETTTDIGYAASFSDNAVDFATVNANSMEGFRAVDDDKNEMLDRKEIEALRKRYHVPKSFPMMHYDLDDNGRLNISEFLHATHRLAKLSEEEIDYEETSASSTPTSRHTLQS
eukprot:TRINITY_DN24523_c0_g1_i1.p1 TRINITY_DN24523_c0_g1~~TRINITY_DN24523_c0_g1_i1.p1  ORF type:complete len:208 (-),score=31.71 TRINITY_DN24523_c0_g1_i1:233-856(-)